MAQRKKKSDTTVSNKAVAETTKEVLKNATGVTTVDENRLNELISPIQANIDQLNSLEDSRILEEVKFIEFNTNNAIEQGAQIEPIMAFPGKISEMDEFKSGCRIFVDVTDKDGNTTAQEFNLCTKAGFINALFSLNVLRFKYDNYSEKLTLYEGQNFLNALEDDNRHKIDDLRKSKSFLSFVNKANNKNLKDNKTVAYDESNINDAFTEYETAKAKKANDKAIERAKTHVPDEKLHKWTSGLGQKTLRHEGYKSQFSNDEGEMFFSTVKSHIKMMCDKNYMTVTRHKTILEAMEAITTETMNA